MRPCNQCRQPVENEVLICPRCEEYNAKHNLQPPKPLKANPAEDLEGGATNSSDRSLGQVANVFYMITVLLGALIGLAVFGTFQAFIIGGLIGLVGCGVFLRMVFAGM